MYGLRKYITLCTCLGYVHKFLHGVLIIVITFIENKKVRNAVFVVNVLVVYYTLLLCYFGKVYNVVICIP